VVGAWGFLIRTGSISTIWPMFGAANQLLGMLALCIGTTVLIKMGKARFLWVTGVPMVFVGAITLAGAYELFALFLARAREAANPAVLYLDAGLVALVALLAVIVLGDSVRQWYGYLVQGRPYRSTEVLLGGGSPARSHPTAGGVQLPGGGCC
jgi:carbon starvation protein